MERFSPERLRLEQPEQLLEMIEDANLQDPNSSSPQLGEFGSCRHCGGRMAGNGSCLDCGGLD
jgi:hypothetical protein